MAPVRVTTGLGGARYWLWRRGDCPANTWQATAAACLDVNATPILVDIEPDTYCLDPDKATAAITPRTRAIIPVHLFNSIADMDRILDLAQRHNVHIPLKIAPIAAANGGDVGLVRWAILAVLVFQSSKSLICRRGWLCHD